MFGFFGGGYGGGNPYHRYNRPGQAWQHGLWHNSGGGVRFPSLHGSGNGFAGLGGFGRGWGGGYGHHGFGGMGGGLFDLGALFGGAIGQGIAQSGYGGQMGYGGRPPMRVAQGYGYGQRPQYSGSMHDGQEGGYGGYGGEEDPSLQGQPPNGAPEIRTSDLVREFSDSLTQMKAAVDAGGNSPEAMRAAGNRLIAASATLGLDTPIDNSNGSRTSARELIARVFPADKYPDPKGEVASLQERIFGGVERYQGAQQQQPGIQQPYAVQPPVTIEDNRNPAVKTMEHAANNIMGVPDPDGRPPIAHAQAFIRAADAYGWDRPMSVDLGAVAGFSKENITPKDLIRKIELNEGAKGQMFGQLVRGITAERARQQIQPSAPVPGTQQVPDARSPEMLAPQR